MNKTVLILTNTEDDVHSEVVISGLLKRGVSVFRFNSDSISGGQTVVNFSAGDDGVSFELLDSTTGQGVSSKDVGSVWYRRPNNFQIKIEDPIQRAYAESELKTFLDGLWLSLPNAFWMNDFHKLERAKRKIAQLFLAKEIGFLLPNTLVTNNPEEALRFVRKCAGSVIFKCLGQESLDYTDKCFRIPTTLLTELHLKNIDLVKSVPALFQQFITKTYDVRVTAVRQKLFAVKIDSQKNPLTTVDWRRPECVGTLHYTETQIPEEVAERCFQLMNELGLVFGAIDFAVDAEGRYWFLEINPNGQWYWLEHFAGPLISETIVDTLIKERR